MNSSFNEGYAFIISSLFFTFHRSSKMSKTFAVTTQFFRDSYVDCIHEATAQGTSLILQMYYVVLERHGESLTRNYDSFLSFLLLTYSKITWTADVRGQANNFYIVYLLFIYFLYLFLSIFLITSKFSSKLNIFFLGLIHLSIFLRDFSTSLEDIVTQQCGKDDMKMHCVLTFKIMKSDPS